MMFVYPLEKVKTAGKGFKLPVDATVPPFVLSLRKITWERVILSSAEELV